MRFDETGIDPARTSGGCTTFALHIEHATTDNPTWKTAFDSFDSFDSFESARACAGVKSHRIGRPVDDDEYVTVDLDFEDVAAAQDFLGFLRTEVWCVPERSPALVGSPSGLIVEILCRSE